MHVHPRGPVDHEGDARQRARRFGTTGDGGGAINPPAKRRPARALGAAAIILGHGTLAIVGDTRLGHQHLRAHQRDDADPAVGRDDAGAGAATVAIVVGAPAAQPRLPAVVHGWALDRRLGATRQHGHRDDD